MNEWSFIITVITVLVCLILWSYQRYRTKKMLDRLNKMLDSAIDGNFTEHSFDESLLSSVESRLNRYLSSSVVSSRNLEAEKNRIKELLSDISHQAKTPLSNILLYAQLLEEHNLPKASGHCIDALQEEAEKLSFLISSLVKLSRLEAGVLSLNPKAQSLSHMFEDVRKQFAPNAEQKTLSLTVQPTQVWAVYDAKWTTEALGNILDNAIKYTPPGGKIDISAKEYELFCRIDIADTGIGISEDEQTKIFMRFFRSRQVSEQQGVGIGLYLARQILAEQDGYIKVSSTLGQGTVFSVFLPRQP